MTRFYAGIGSRETPLEITDEMLEFAADMTLGNYVLRSGGADGADHAFEAGCDWASGKKQIFLPWSGFNNRKATARIGSEMFGVFDYVSAEAMSLAEKHHPAWHAMGRGARALHARNGYQVLGPTLNEPVEFVVCWTRGGSGAGGTGQALRIAKAYSIPVYDLGSPSRVTSRQIIEAHR